ncbi:DEAD-box ATP-dependent RNA helicase [Chloropicon primus]|uniref:ATP-dependent RNA helicase n=1 Tax=Chloropicon primus TaxID=1764295 RepID=A0A5B8MK53_9CHLO|nr:DEAD-box ATP-dependent RNA helicase [Chloropicon primus]UPR00045.1 DEAD-box ATP-dependent RNA helicase [Chloropicon primus]|eukprot:QDZ20833.1 DEAD-box ATP-dependent RNA helicase [Chloropicon primus]
MAYVGLKDTLRRLGRLKAALARQSGGGILNAGFPGGFARDLRVVSSHAEEKRRRRIWAPISSLKSAGARATGFRARARQFGTGGGGAPGGEEASWVSLGLKKEVAASLVSSGFPFPSQTQKLAVPKVVAGGDVVVAAETGSGKTIAYLAPILDKLSRLLESRGGDTAVALVLCPNVQLCKQVSGVAKELLGGASLSSEGSVRVFDVTEDEYEEDGAAVVVCTPSLFEKTFVSYKAGAARVDLNVKVLVLDETDMLLTGGFEPVTLSILDWCQYEDKQLKIDSVLENTGMTYEDFQKVPYKFRRAAYKEGLPGMLASGWRGWKGHGSTGVKGFEKCQYLFTGATIPDYGTKSVELQIQKICPDVSWVRGEGLHNPSSFKERLAQEWIEVRSMGEAYDLLSDIVSVKGNGPGTEGEDLGGLTVPELKQRLRDAELPVSGRKAELVQRLVELGGPVAAGTSSSIGRVVAFNKDVRHAMECAEALRDSEGLPVLEFHRKVPLEERMDNLEVFKRAKNAVLVCTDAASRGLDIPDVSCVVQVGFASSAVDYLHRIGRTARAGKRGRVVNIYTGDSLDLVRSVTKAIKEERPVQDAFSRKRSFRKKIKKESRKNY